MATRPTGSKLKMIASFVLTIGMAGAVIAFTMKPQPVPTGDKACYSDDDGATWFVDSAYKIVPFDHDGKQAVRAVVFTYAGGSKQFVVCLIRYTERGRQKIAEAMASAQNKSLPLSSIDLFNDMSIQEVKACGANQSWTPRKDRKAQPIMTIHSPDGSAVDMVIP